MTVEAYKCNARDCKGYIVFDNADFDFNNMSTDKELDIYVFEKPKCTECGHEFYVVPSYTVADISKNNDYKELTSSSITNFERREMWREFEEEISPSKKIELFIKLNHYSYDVSHIINGYREYKNHGYVSYTMKNCIVNLEDEIKLVLQGLK